jgi:hypothetical protein
MNQVKYLSLDWEFNGSNESILNLVSGAYCLSGSKPVSVWLHKDKAAQKTLKEFFLSVRDEVTLLAFNVDAEAKGIIALGLNPIKFKWIDIQAEWRMLTNHCDKYRYGKHFFNGKIKTTYRQEYRDWDDNRPHDKPPGSLLGCTYKMLGTATLEDYETKNKMRDVILDVKNPDRFTAKVIEEILSYGASDVADLEEILEKMIVAYKGLYRSKFDPELLREEMLWRGETVARAALISAIGYPVNRKKITNFVKNIPKMIKNCQEDINSQFPEMDIFKWSKPLNRYTLNTKAVKNWVEHSGLKSNWNLTDTAQVSIGLDAFEKHFSYRHSFPRGVFPAQFLRYLKLNQSLNGYKPKGPKAKNKDTFFSYYGSDDRAHPYLNAYGAQSARYQPKATGFIHLKAAWMRSLVEPKVGRVIASIDYGSEEFLLGGLISGDKNMIEAYRSGDVYLYFAKLAGAVPWEGTKKEYVKERDLFKSTTLGISYQMGPAALGRKLSLDVGEEISYSDAYGLIEMFREAYPDYAQWIKDSEEDYEDTGYIKLADGWTMFGDNDNLRSAVNMPIQGMGSVILRKAIQLCQDRGLTVILPLHDAAYIELDLDDSLDSNLLTFSRCMREAFGHYFKGPLKDQALELIRMDGNIWGPGMEAHGSRTIDQVFYKAQDLYIDSRSEQEYKQFSKYFNNEV